MGLVIHAMQHGMIWIGLDQVPLNPDRLNRLSFYLGAAGQARYGQDESALHDGDRETGVLHGARIADFAQKLAIVLGCPTFMGDVSGPMKAFIDATLDRWYPRVWSGKVAGGFTVSSTPACLSPAMSFERRPRCMVELPATTQERLSRSRVCTSMRSLMGACSPNSPMS